MSERALELTDLLRSLQEGGQQDSSGSFTLDLERAAPKLRRYLLRNPWHYSLKLIQAGVSAGCAEIRVDCSNQRFQVQFADLAWQAADLRHLFYCLLEANPTRANRSLRQLATAINSAVHLGAHAIEVRVADGRSAFVFDWTAEGPRQRDLGPSREPKNTIFTLRRALGEVAEGWWNFLHRDPAAVLMRDRKALDREAAMLHDRCRFVPVPMRVNGRRWPASPWARETPVAQLCVPAEADGEGFPWSAQGRFQAVLTLPEQRLEHSEIFLVEDGVLLAAAQPYLGLPPVRAVVSAHGLNKDLDGFTLNQDEVYQRMLRELGRQARRLREQVRRDQELYPAFVRNWIVERHWDGES